MQLAVDTLPSHDASSTRNDADVTNRNPLRPQNATHCGSVAEPRWAAVHTHPQAEHWANSNLRQRGYTTWLPLVTVRRRDRVIRTMFRDVAIPAFTRYVFIRHTPGSPWSPIRYTEGVHDVVRMGMQPAHADDMAIAALQEALQAGQRSGGQQHSGYPPGTATRWLAGPLRGHDAIVLSSNANLTTVSVIMLGALRTVTVPTADLIPRD